ncbi:MAG TPA: hypothetical protein VLA83_16195, partial [Candidatus Binatia bacterium]|nr:hypothetical protein [Candidatus Binatia bacterium]
MKCLLQYAAILLVLLLGSARGQGGNKSDLPALACESFPAATLDDPAAAAKKALCSLVRKAAAPQPAAGAAWVRLQDQTLKFYLPYGFQPAWTENGRPASQARALIHVLKEAEKKGLQPEDSAGPKWEASVARFDVAGPVSPDVVAEFDFA